MPRAAVSSASGWLSAAVYADFICWPLFYPGAALFSLACIPVGACLVQPVFLVGGVSFRPFDGLLIRGGSLTALIFNSLHSPAQPVSAVGII